jgi:hypothetical protein
VFLRKQMIEHVDGNEAEQFAGPAGRLEREPQEPCRGACAATSAAIGKFRSSLTSRIGECKGGEMSDLGKPALMAYWSGRTMLARARSTIGAKLSPQKSNH